MIGLTRDRLLVALYVALYGLTLLALHIFEHFALGEALILLVVILIFNILSTLVLQRVLGKNQAS